MHRRSWMAYLLVFLYAGILQAQTQFSIRAASKTAVEGWQRIQLEHFGTTFWISPSATVVSSDIEKAQPETRADGTRVVRVVFTAAGTSKMRSLTTAQLGKHVALVVDGKLIWAPVIQVAVGKESILTGSLPGGLTEEEVRWIMTSLHQ